MRAYIDKFLVMPDRSRASGHHLLKEPAVFHYKEKPVTTPLENEGKHYRRKVKVVSEPRVALTPTEVDLESSYLPDSCSRLVQVVGVVFHPLRFP